MSTSRETVTLVAPSVGDGGHYPSSTLRGRRVGGAHHTGRRWHKPCTNVALISTTRGTLEHSVPLIKVAAHQCGRSSKWPLITVARSSMWPLIKASVGSAREASDLQHGRKVGSLHLAQVGSQGQAR